MNLKKDHESSWLTPVKALKLKKIVCKFILLQKIVLKELKYKKSNSC